MTSSRRSTRVGRWIGRSLLPLLLTLGGSAVFTPGLVAQELADSVSARTTTYQEALTTWRAAVTARQAAADRLGESVEDIDRARRLGDDDTLTEALRRAQSLARENERLDARVAEVEARLDVARQGLIEALDARLAQLERMLQEATDPVEQRRLDAFVDDLQNQYAELAQDATSEMAALPDFYPALRLDPRDGPSEWEIKAQLLERKARTAEEQIEEARGEVSRLERRLQLQRLQQDSRANRDRFGDALPPVGNRLEQSAEAIVADTTGVPLDQLPFDQQIAIWELYIAQLEALRDQVTAQAQEFRRRLGRRAVVR